MVNMQRFVGKRVVVTGAASGIGEATLTRFRDEGARWESLVGVGGDAAPARHVGSISEHARPRVEAALVTGE